MLDRIDARRRELESPSTEPREGPAMEAAPAAEQQPSDEQIARSKYIMDPGGESAWVLAPAVGQEGLQLTRLEKIEGQWRETGYRTVPDEEAARQQAGIDGEFRPLSARADLAQAPPAADETQDVGTPTEV